MIRSVMTSARPLICLSSRQYLLAGVEHLTQFRVLRAPWVCLRLAALHQMSFYQQLPVHRLHRRPRLPRPQSRLAQLSTSRYLPASQLSTQPFHPVRHQRATGLPKPARSTRRQNYAPANRLLSIRLLNYVRRVRSRPV